MASSPDFVAYAVAQLAGAGDVTCRKMFGEYGIYCDGKFCAVICDNQLMLKITPPGELLLADCPRVLPYTGATQYYFLIDSLLEDSAALTHAVAETCRALPPPKAKKK